MTNLIKNFKDLFRTENAKKQSETILPSENDFAEKKLISQIDSLVDEINAGNVQAQYQPSVDSTHSNEQQKQVRSLLADFMARDHYTQGYKDGSQFHKSDILRLRKNSMKEEMVNAIEVQLNRLRENAYSLKANMADIQEMDDMRGAESVLRVKLEEQYDKINKLESYIQLLRINQGPLFKAIQQYETGYHCGYTDFLTADTLFTKEQAL